MSDNFKSYALRPEDSIDRLGLSTPVAKCLAEFGVSTINELTTLSESDLLGILNVNRLTTLPIDPRLQKTEFNDRLTAVGEVRRRLGDHGFSLWGGSSDTPRTPYFEARGLARKLSMSIDILRLSVRAENCLKAAGIYSVGDLVKQTEVALLKLPNLGKTTIIELKGRLSEMGLDLGLKINDVRVRNDEDAGVDTELAPVPRMFDEVDTIEDQLDALLKFTINPRLHQVMRMRLGWGSQKIPTLEMLAKDVELSGLENVVTRERIRQIVARGENSLKKIMTPDNQPPALLRAIELLNEQSPISESKVVSILGSESLTRIDFGYDALKNWAEVCKIEWLLADIGDFQPGARIFVSVLDEEVRDQFGSLLPEIGRLCRGRTFQSIKEVSERLLGRTSIDDDLIRTLISLSQNYEWLDEEKNYFWKLPATNFYGRGNRVVSVCRRLFSAVDRCHLGLVSAAVGRAVKRGHCSHKVAKTLSPPEEVLGEMLRQTGLFEVHEKYVKRAKGVQFNELNETDIHIIRATRGMGKLVNFTQLCENAVREGMTLLSAHVATVYSPFVAPVSRGQYQVLPNVDELDLDRLSLVVESTQSQFDDDEDIVPEMVNAERLFEVEPRTLLTGKCKLTGEVVSDSEWEVINESEEALGICKIQGNRVSQIKDILTKVGAKQGDIVQVFLNEEEGRAVFKFISHNV